MTNVTKFGGSNALASLGGLGAALQNVVNTTTVSTGDPYLRLLRDGGFVYGAENTEVEEGSKWAVNPLSIKHGYACWTRKNPKLKQKDELIGEAMVPATLPKPDRNGLKRLTFVDFGGVETEAEWAEQVSFQLQCVTGEDAGTETLYKTTSKGGLKATTQLLTEIVNRIGEATDGTVVPVIELLSSFYDHPQYGKTFYPVFKVHTWVGMDQAPKESELGPRPDPGDPLGNQPSVADTPATGAPVRRRRN